MTIPISTSVTKATQEEWRMQSLNAYLQNWKTLGLELPNSMRGISAFGIGGKSAQFSRHPSQSMLIEAIHSVSFMRPETPHYHLDYQAKVRKMAEVWDEQLHALFVGSILVRLKEMGREPGPPLKLKSCGAPEPSWFDVRTRSAGPMIEKLKSDHGWRDEYEAVFRDKVKDFFIEDREKGSFSTTGTTGSAKGKTTSVEILEKMGEVRRAIGASKPMWPFAAGDRGESGKSLIEAMIESKKALHDSIATSTPVTTASPFGDALRYGLGEAGKEVFVRSSDQRAKIPSNADVNLSDEEAHALMTGGTW